MNKTQTLSAALLLVVFLLAACKKEKSGDGSFMIYNNTGKPFHIDVYDDFADYVNYVEPMFQADIPARSKHELALSQFQKNRTYYAEWHTPDYLYSSWGRWINKGFQLKDKDNYLEITETYPSLRQLLFLDGNKKQTSWKMCDAYSKSNAHLWPSLPIYEKEKRIILRRDLQVLLQYQDSTGQVKTDSLTFEPLELLNMPIAARVYKNMAGQLWQVYFLFNETPSSHIAAPGSDPGTLDTLMLTEYDHDWKYFFVKE